MLKLVQKNVKLQRSLTQLRLLSKLSAKYEEKRDTKMQAWQIHSYGGFQDLKLSNVRIPVIAKPSHVLIKIEASSVNPIDVAMTRGYGSTTFNFIRKTKSFGSGNSEIEFPLTLGRDFSGIVVAKGHGVGERLKLGDQVWGVVPVDQQGCHADYVVVDDCLVNLHPQNLSYIEASSILYAGLTAWSALWITGGLCYKTAIPRINRRILILGGSGGVGTIAIQLCKAWNTYVIATCSSDAVNMLEKLGADIVIDYKGDNADEQIISEGPYDIILDCCQQGPDRIKEKGYPFRTYITLNSPLLKNVDEHGLIGGAVKNLGNLFKYNIPSKEKGGTVKWGFFAPSQTGIGMIQDLVERGQIVPVVQKVYPVEELPRAYERMSEGHSRGKLVIDMKR